MLKVTKIKRFGSLACPIQSMCSTRTAFPVRYSTSPKLKNTVRRLNKDEDARMLVRGLFISGGITEPDEPSKTLTARIHKMTSPARDETMAALLKDLSGLEFCHLETGQKMTCALAGCAVKIFARIRISEV